MSIWVALLRGVNVNGITVRSADLAGLFRDLGFEQVKTVLASGNVRFNTSGDDSADTQEKLRQRIEAGLRERFGYDAWIVLVPHEALADLIDAYPFAQDSEHHAYVVFASTEEARDDLLSGVRDGGADAVEHVAGGAGVVYWRCPKGGSTDTPFSKHAAKARFKATTTNRNINTLRKLL
jgi:uncharacterized protein (DUF1697 family)